MDEAILKLHSPTALWRPVAFDLWAFAAVLSVFGFAFYLHWDLWEDQAAQTYMTWGMFHGMRPYVDLVDPNWPGILLPHTIAYCLSGVDGWGLRLLDLVFSFAMLTATSVFLEAWGVPAAMRVLAGCAYLTNYFATGWMWTAQRESFGWPLLVIGALPLLVALAPRGTIRQTKQFGRFAQLVLGMICGLSLWIKPAPLPCLIAIDLVALTLCDAIDRRRVVNILLWQCIGIMIVSLFFIVTLAAFGGLGGFIKWGIRYDLGPYAQIKFPLAERWRRITEFLTNPVMRPAAMGLCVIGLLAMVIVPRSWRKSRFPTQPLRASIALVFAAVITVFWQGKPSSFYHFIPLDWALAVLAAAIWSVFRWTRPLRDAAVVLASFLVVITIYEGPSSEGPTAGSIAAYRMLPSLAPDDQLVVWGYAPSLLLRAQKKTPFMTFIGSAFLVTSPPHSWAAREVLDRLNIALHDPSVHFLLVERVPNFRIQTGVLKWPKDYLQSDSALKQTLLDQYQLLPFDSQRGFDVFLHTIARR